MHTIKANIQTLAILLVAIAFLIGLSIMVGPGVQPYVAVAQEPLPSPEAVRKSFSQERLAAFGLSLEDIQAAAGPFNLQVTVTANPPNLPSGGQATYTVNISNLGTTTAQYIIFSQSLPAGMSGGTPNFAGGGVNAIPNGPNPTAWLITNQIPSGNSIQFTVQGNITSTCNVTASYIANAVPFESGADPNLNNNTGIGSLNVVAGKVCIYFPIIRRDPTPTPNPIVFFDNFSGTQNWSTSDDSDCERRYTSGEYEVVAKTKDELCFGPAPGAAERSFGTFKVKARRESGSSNFAVAIYINGQGDGNYYAFEVKPDDDCGWRLIRRRDGSSSEVRSGGCESVINRDSGSNILEIRH
ncbi:MAG TPA: hypothetical protein VEC96_06520, partial [Anaerolineae bacterium]|nr:hypothetical protein [Anaerolineae bacterium]